MMGHPSILNSLPIHKKALIRHPPPLLYMSFITINKDKHQCVGSIDACRWYLTTPS